MKKYLFALLVVAGALTSCKTSKTMRDANARLNVAPSDLTMTSTVSAEATVVKVLGIDWKRLFKKTTGSVEGAPTAGFSIPVLGAFIMDQSQSYALYNLYDKNPGYDCVVFPKFTTKSKNFIVFSKTTTKVEAKLGKLK